MPGADEDLDALLNKVDDSFEQSGEAVRTVSEVNKERMGKDRSWIAKSIIFTYAAAIVGAVLYILFSVPACTVADCVGDDTAWAKQGELLMDLIVTAVVPIVTLMLGFYFATEGSNND